MGWGGGGSSSDGMHAPDLSPSFNTLPISSLQTCTCYRAGTGPRRSNVEQEAYGVVRGNIPFPSEASPPPQILPLDTVYSFLAWLHCWGGRKGFVLLGRQKAHVCLLQQRDTNSTYLQLWEQNMQPLTANVSFYGAWGNWLSICRLLQSWGTLAQPLSQRQVHRLIYWIGASEAQQGSKRSFLAHFPTGE